MKNNNFSKQEPASYDLNFSSAKNHKTTPAYNKNTTLQDIVDAENKRAEMIRMVGGRN